MEALGVEPRSSRSAVSPNYVRCWDSALPPSQALLASAGFGPGAGPLRAVRFVEDGLPYPRLSRSAKTGPAPASPTVTRSLVRRCGCYCLRGATRSPPHYTATRPSTPTGAPRNDAMELDSAYSLRGSDTSAVLPFTYFPLLTRPAGPRHARNQHQTLNRHPSPPGSREGESRGSVVTFKVYTSGCILSSPNGGINSSGAPETPGAPAARPAGRSDGSLAPPRAGPRRALPLPPPANCAGAAAPFAEADKSALR
jgi:hypothetical protein